NVNRSEGRAKLSSLSASLASTVSGARVAVLWPGDHWVGPASYPLEGRDADDSAWELKKFITDNLRRGTRLRFAAHSLGCRVVMQVLKLIRGGDYIIDQVCLMAAAIDNDSLAATAEYRPATENASRVAVLSSTQDTVLRYAYPMGDLLQAFLFSEEEFRSALGLRGPRPSSRPFEAIPLNVLHRAIPDGRKARHSDYLPDEPPNANQQSAARFAAAILAGTLDVMYA
ncbi:MAG: alpha/beta hydrolase, partial [Gammaproteobacteria bacterium]